MSNNPTEIPIPKYIGVDNKDFRAMFAADDLASCRNMADLYRLDGKKFSIYVLYQEHE